MQSPALWWSFLYSMSKGMAQCVVAFSDRKTNILSSSSAKCGREDTIMILKVPFILKIPQHWNKQNLNLKLRYDLCIKKFTILK